MREQQKRQEQAQRYIEQREQQKEDQAQQELWAQEEEKRREESRRRFEEEREIELEALRKKERERARAATQAGIARPGSSDGRQRKRKYASFTEGAAGQAGAQEGGGTTQAKLSRTADEAQLWRQGPWLTLVEAAGAPPFGESPLQCCIKHALSRRLGKLRTLLVVVKSVESRTRITVADPSGSMQATLNQKLVDAAEPEESLAGKLPVGTGIELKDVSLLEPAPNKFYLNIGSWNNLGSIINAETPYLGSEIKGEPQAAFAPGMLQMAAAPRPGGWGSSTAGHGFGGHQPRQMGGARPSVPQGVGASSSDNASAPFRAPRPAPAQQAGSAGHGQQQPNAPAVQRRCPGGCDAPATTLIPGPGRDVFMCATCAADQREPIGHSFEADWEAQRRKERRRAEQELRRSELTKQSGMATDGIGAGGGGGGGWGVGGGFGFGQQPPPQPAARAVEASNATQPTHGGDAAGRSGWGAKPAPAAWGGNNGRSVFGTGAPTIAVGGSGANTAGAAATGGSAALTNGSGWRGGGGGFGGGWGQPRSQGSAAAAWQGGGTAAAAATPRQARPSQPWTPLPSPAAPKPQASVWSQGNAARTPLGPVGGGGGLTAEQRARIEENKAKALARRAARLQAQGQAGHR